MPYICIKSSEIVVLDQRVCQRRWREGAACSLSVDIHVFIFNRLPIVLICSYLLFERRGAVVFHDHSLNGCSVGFSYAMCLMT